MSINLCPALFISISMYPLCKFFSSFYNYTAPITCPVPSLPNGRVLRSPSGPVVISPLLINTVIYYQCNNGWPLRGEKSSQCVLVGESGVLNGTVPTCIRTNPGGNALTTSSSKLPSIFSSTTSSNSIKGI